MGISTVRFMASYSVDHVTTRPFMHYTKRFDTRLFVLSSVLVFFYKEQLGSGGSLHESDKNGVGMNGRSYRRRVGGWFVILSRVAINSVCPLSVVECLGVC